MKKFLLKLAKEDEEMRKILISSLQKLPKMSRSQMMRLVEGYFKVFYGQNKGPKFSWTETFPDFVVNMIDATNGPDYNIDLDLLRKIAVVKAKEGAKLEPDYE